MEKQIKNTDTIIIRHLLNEATEEENLFLLTWLKDNEANRKYFFDFKEIWMASRQKIEDKTNTDNSWTNLKASLKDGKAISLKDKKRVYISIFKYAAAAVFIFGLGFAGYKYFNKYQKEVPVTYTELKTLDGQKKEITLPDGTNIWLNSGTTLNYANTFGQQNREVFLIGEAYFNVTRDTTKTFIVRTDNITIKVLGTSFNVRSYPDLGTIETTVITGTVSLENSTEDIKDVVILNKKEKATFLKENKKMYISGKKEKDEPKSGVEPIELRKVSLNDEEADYIASWKDQTLSFNNESFEEIAFKLQRWFNVKITIKDQKLKGYRYKGKFQNANSIIQVLEVVKLTTPIKYEINPKTKEVTITELK